MHVGDPVLNMYAEAAEESSVVSQVLYGQEVVILDSKNGYSHIQSADSYCGWVISQSLYPKAEMKKGMRTIHLSSHVYRTPSVTQEKPLMTLPYGVEVEVITEPAEEKGRWVELGLIDGSHGWIQRGNLMCQRQNLTHSQMLELSCQFLGLPYTWGGSSSFGYDCSGYVQMLFSEMGILLPRDAHQQIKSPLCREVDIVDLAPGDLLFYGDNEEKIKHVGLYLGNQQLIQASVLPLPLVQISSLNCPSLKERFAYATARRL